jgi:hypothetical protein
MPVSHMADWSCLWAMVVPADIPTTVTRLETAKAKKTLRILCESCTLGKIGFMAFSSLLARTHNSAFIAGNPKVAVTPRMKERDLRHGPFALPNL